MSKAVFDPRLLVVFGYGKGTVCRIPADIKEFPVGRAADNMFVILDPAASQHHFSVQVLEDRAILRDGDTTNGTRVNNIAQSTWNLKHGDRIRMGMTIVIYLEHEDVLDAIEDLKDEIDDEIIWAQRAQTMVLTPRQRESEFIDYRDVWSAVRNTSRYVNAIGDLKQLQIELLKTAFDIIPADRGAILLNGYRLSPDPVDLISQVYVERKYDGPPRSLLNSLNSLALEEVYRTRKAHINNKVIPVMCVPIFVDGTMRGVFYLDSLPGKFSQFRFQAEHLEFAGAFAENLDSAIRMQRKFETVENERDLLQASRSIERPIVGNSKAIHKLLQEIANAAAFDSTVLILGETGTGKELVAQAIHRLSNRESKPFAAVNCGGVQEHLLQSELCGHAKGAFTGAVVARKGKLRQADGGTVFLDEMGELPIGLQPSLLRVLQEKKVDVIGEEKPVDVDVRIIAATNVDLEKAVEDGRFRSDLYYRLKVVVIQLPPLRNRPEDIPLLADHFLKKYRRNNVEISIALEAFSALLSYSWPGNVREFENAIEAAIVRIYRTSNVIGLDALPDCIRAPKTSTQTIPESDVLQRSRASADAVMAAALKRRWQENGGNVREAAAHVGIGKTKAYELLRDDI